MLWDVCQLFFHFFPYFVPRKSYFDVLFLLPLSSLLLVLIVLLFMLFPCNDEARFLIFICKELNASLVSPDLSVLDDSNAETCISESSSANILLITSSVLLQLKPFLNWGKKYTCISNIFPLAENIYFWNFLSRVPFYLILNCQPVDKAYISLT